MTSTFSGLPVFILIWTKGQLVVSFTSEGPHRIHFLAPYFTVARFLSTSRLVSFRPLVTHKDRPSHLSPRPEQRSVTSRRNLSPVALQSHSRPSYSRSDKEGSVDVDLLTPYLFHHSLEAPLPRKVPLVYFVLYFSLS